MKLVILTIVLDGWPFIKWQYDCFQKLTCDWRWIVVEGAAQNNSSTRWCKPQERRASSDGTSAYLGSLCDDKVWYGVGCGWSSKDEMVNRGIQEITEPCVLMQIDVDEIHKPESIDAVVRLFENDETLGLIRFPCRYFVGPKLVCEGENCWSNKQNEYDRAWRFEPGMRFLSHEPPLLNPKPNKFSFMSREMSRKEGLTFDHLSWVLESQVKYKSEFYGAKYSNAVNQWKALQRNEQWPAKLSRFFPWVEGNLPTVKKVNSNGLQ